MSGQTISCPRCGRQNPLSQVFCSECGAKLDLSQVRSGDFRQRNSGAAVGRVLWVLVRTLFQVGLVAALALMLWPAAQTGARGGRERAEQAKDKISLLHSAVENNLERIVVFQEEGINGYLSALAQASKRSDARSRRRGSDGGGLAVENVNMRFNEDSITVLVVARMGPAALSYEVSGVPDADGESFTYAVTGARIGHLPLPGFLASPIAHKVKGVFAPLRKERMLLERIDRMAVSDGAVKVGVRPRNPKP